MNEQRLLRIEELAAHLGCSVKTINVWYSWARKHPDNTLALCLPEYEKIGGVRYWNVEDSECLKNFQQSLPRGRSGILGDVTQQYKDKNYSKDHIEDLQYQRRKKSKRLAHEDISAEYEDTSSESNMCNNSIEALGLSHSIENALKRQDVFMIDQLRDIINCRQPGMRNIPGIGTIRRAEIVNYLERYDAMHNMN